ncbi:MAG TPA: zeta toxin family protein [Elusimicrobiota bacterium]|nr:zeta toxin family protein [Elusimicrobiota bacterium]
MKPIAELDRRPVLVAIAGPNGAGKTTFYGAHIAPAGLRYVNADVIARELGAEPYAAADAAAALRRALVLKRESFAFETVFSDPVGDKLKFLREAAATGYTVALCFVGIATPELSEERVAMRVSQGGHDVPAEKLRSRFPRTLANLKAAARTLPFVFVYDNSDLARPFREVAVFARGRLLRKSRQVPAWLGPLAGSDASKKGPHRPRP